MKREILTLLALSCALVSTAQDSDLPAKNAVLISQTRNGNTITSRYKVPHNSGKHAEFDLHYTINKADIVTSVSDNNKQIEALQDFMEQSNDSTLHIASIQIVGYASPDGNQTKNDTLAAKRAQALYHYAVNTYHPKLPIQTKSKTFQWADCVTAIESSAIPSKAEVLRIVQSDHKECDKELQLRKIPQAWNYLTTLILPQMRYADIAFDYGEDEIVTRTTLVANPTPPTPPKQTTPTPATKEPEVVLVEDVTGIIIATPKENKHQHRKDKSKKHHSKKRGKKKSSPEERAL